MKQNEQKEFVDTYAQLILDDFDDKEYNLCNIQDIILNLFCKLQLGTLTQLQKKGKPLSIDEIIEVYDIATTTLCTDGREQILKILKDSGRR